MTHSQINLTKVRGFLSLIVLILLVGCTSFQDCYDTCINTYKHTKLEFSMSYCATMNFFCMNKPSHALKEYCFNQCKPKCEKVVYEEKQYWNWTDGISYHSGCWDCDNPECKCIYVRKEVSADSSQH